MNPAGISAYFPLAGHYAPVPSAHPHLLKEAGGSRGGRVFAYTERHLQAVWYDPRWRPQRLVSHRGEEIRVESPGIWNLDAGPDFLGAILLVGPEQRRLCGDVEIHVFPAGWKQHGHSSDRRYRNVCLHVTYFEGVLDASELPVGALQTALRSSLKADPSFSFEHVDVTAYPYAGRADLPPCRRILAQWPIDNRRQLLEAAGHERMRRKSERFSDMIRERGVDQVIYEAMMAALGYQHNKPPFQRLAGLLPVDHVRVLAEGDPRRAYAILAGVSGLLPADFKSGWDEETRQYVRALWDVWWKVRDHLPEPLQRETWRLRGIRPLNHPLRRLAAAAHVITRHPDGLALLEHWALGSPGQLLARLESTLANDVDPYWRRHASLGGKRSPTDVVLIGRERWEAVALNIVIPMAAACGLAPDQVNQLLSHLRPEASNRNIRESVFYLFGPDYPSELIGTANRRQGLLQIFHDYCLNDRSQCHTCSFPGQLKAGWGRPPD